MKKLKREDLKPGMILRNTKTGNTGEARGNKDVDLVLAAPDYVAVHTQVMSGPRKGKSRYSYWRVDALELVE